MQILFTFLQYIYFIAPLLLFCYNESDSKIVISEKQDFVESPPQSLLDI